MVTVKRLTWAIIPLFALVSGWYLFARADETGYHVIKKIKVGGEGFWDYLTLDSEARRLYISRGNRVQVMDVDKEMIVGEVPKCPGIHGIALVPKLDRGFTSNGQDASVTVFDLKTLKEVDRVKVGMRPDAILYDPVSGRVFTFNAGSKDASAIDPESGKVVGTVKLGGKPESAVADDQGKIYVNMEDKDEVATFDAKDLTLSSRYPVSPGKAPVGLSIDIINRRLFVTCQNQKMVIMDCNNGKVVASLPIGRGTDFCVFDREPSLAFSSNGDGTLTVVHEETPNQFRVVANVPTERGARTMALDAKMHNIYLVTASFKPAPAPAAKAKGKQRPGMVPDSFVVLVVGKKQ
jgi:DNA-binding beta-propeller fold protein YncE